MYYLLAILMGGVVPLMLVMNSGLQAHYGLYAATVIVQGVGAVTTLAVMTVKREWGKKRPKLPVYYYVGGLIGYFTLASNTMAFSYISASAMTALLLLGQSVISVLLDHFGWFGTQVRRFNSKKLLGMGFVLLGIVVMLAMSGGGNMVQGVLLCLAGGTCIVLSRTAGARLTDKTSVWYSTLWNYITGLGLSVLVFLLMDGSFAPLAGTATSPWMYLGGFIGLSTVVINNLVVPRISVFSLTLLNFFGQSAVSLLTDTLLAGSFQPSLLAGGLLVSTGMVFITLVDKQDDEKRKADKA